MISSLSLSKTLHVWLCLCVCFGVEGLGQRLCVCVCLEGATVGGVGGRAVGQLSVKPNKSFRLSTFACGGAKSPRHLLDDAPGARPLPPPLTPPSILLLPLTSSACVWRALRGAQWAARGPLSAPAVPTLSPLSGPADVSAATPHHLPLRAGGGGGGRGTSGRSRQEWRVEWGGRLGCQCRFGPVLEGSLLLLNIIWCPASCCRCYYLAARTH